MGRPHNGIYRDKQGHWWVDKIYRSTLLHQCFGQNPEEAQSWLIHQLEHLRQSHLFGTRAKRTFDEAAATSPWSSRKTWIEFTVFLIFFQRVSGSGLGHCDIYATYQAVTPSASSQMRDYFEAVVGGLGMPGQEHAKHERLATGWAGTDRAGNSYALSGTDGPPLANRLRGIHSPGASAGIRIPRL